MSFAVQKLQGSLNSVSNSRIGLKISTLEAPIDGNWETITKIAIPPLMDVFHWPIYYICWIRIEGMTNAVNKLEGLADFKLAMDRI